MQLELLFFVSKQSERSRPSPAWLSVAWKMECFSYFAHTVLRWLIIAEMNSRNALVKAVNSDDFFFHMHVFLDKKRILERLGQLSDWRHAHLVVLGLYKRKVRVVTMQVSCKITVWSKTRTKDARVARECAFLWIQNASVQIEEQNRCATRRIILEDKLEIES